MNINKCYFCGGNTKLSGKRKGSYRRKGTLYYVRCNKCGARGPMISGKDGKWDGTAYVGGENIEGAMAIADWNGIHWYDKVLEDV